MKIYFVRHGHPNYVDDCLTELGHKQAVAAAERLKNCGIERIFSSTKGRAVQTAEYTAKKLGLEVIQCDFIKEIGWASLDGEPILANGHPWEASDIFASEGKSLTDKDWRLKEPFCKSELIKSSERVITGLDKWLLELGYKREGDYYRLVSKPTENKIAMFSHGGSSSVALSHILNIPFPQVCGIFHPELTSITVVEFSDKPNELFCPKLLLFNDAEHIIGIDTKNVYDM